MAEKTFRPILTYADEFHHAVTIFYRRIVEYFKPKFLLGLTATPERMDGKSIYELCDYNVPYEISLKEAINKGMLVPFRYYGIFDDTDYSQLHLVKGRYDEKELNEIYIGNVRRHDLISKFYNKYGSKRALGFCCSRKHAEEMAGEFSRRGIPSVAVYSDANGDYSEDRRSAVEKLEAGTVRVIFCVDMFNEGLDIPDIDMVMFLRPTESPVVFMQQLGRGLRKSKGKEYLKVLDFIGNYHKAGSVRCLLYGNSLTNKTKISLDKQVQGEQDDLPDDCQVDFDMRLMDLFAEMDRRSVKVKELVVGEYQRIKEELGKVPSRMEVFTYMDDQICDLMISRAQENIFRDYLGFLHNMGDLSAEQEKLYGCLAKDFLNMIETTDMSRVYKMPVLMSFYNNGDVLMDVDEERLLTNWKGFFDKGRNWKDLNKEGTFEEYKAISDKKHISKIKNMPVHFLFESGKGFFVQKEGAVLALNDAFKDVIKLPGFAEEMKDVIEYRTMNYYQRRYRMETEEDR